MDTINFSGQRVAPRRLEDQRAPLPTGTVTFLLADVAKSTRFWESDPDGAASAIARIYELLDGAIIEHRGSRPVEQGEGDSVVGSFARATDAVAAALQAQRLIAAEPWPHGRAVQVRMAVHTGEARLRDEGNYFGPTVIRCARLRAVAHAGQTLISNATADLAAEQLPEGAYLRNLGTHRLKDLDRIECVWQLCHADLDAEFPPLLSMDHFPNNLPVQLTEFVGREAAIADLRHVVESARLVTLTGVGGCGKTRLAVQLAADLVDRYPGGTWWSDLSQVTDPDLIPQVLASALGLRSEPDRPLLETLFDQLREQDTLVVLDNCEHVLGACATFAEQLLCAAPGLSVLATSREPLGITGEVTWRCPSLDGEEAVRLFRARAALVRPGYSFEESEEEAIVTLCERLDGLPLAIELAAARTRLLAPSRISAGLDDRFRLLTGGTRGAVSRQQTLEASVAWSHDLLSEAERTLFRRLSVFAGGFTLEAAEAVGSNGDIDSYAVFGLLGQLVDKSLVQAHTSGTSRFRMLETLRQYAGHRLVEAGESDAVRDRHLAWFQLLAERAAPQIGGAEGPLRLYELEHDHDNLQRALSYAEAKGDEHSLLRMIGALGGFWELRGHLGVASSWYERALSEEAEPSAPLARALWAAAHNGIYGGAVQTTLRYGPRAIATAEMAGDEQTALRAAIALDYLAVNLDPRTALPRLTAHIETARASGDEWAVADGLKFLSIGYGVSGDLAAAEVAAKDLRAVADRLGNKFFLAWSHAVFGYCALHHGEFAEARGAFQASVHQCAEVGDPITGWLATAWLGDVDAATGHFASARERYDAVLGRGAASGGDLARHFVVPALGELLLGLGREDELSALVQAETEHFAEEVPLFSSRFFCLRGACLLEHGDLVGARAAFEQAWLRAEGVGNAKLVADAQGGLARLARREEDLDEAEDRGQRALTLRHQHQLTPGVVESLELLGGLAACRESATEAARLFAAAQAARRAIDLVRLPAHGLVYDADVATARRQLGDEEFDAAWAEGEDLDLDAAVAYASRARGERKRPRAGWASLTPTEAEVVKLAAKGLTNPEIAERMFIGRGTVKTHLAHVFAKLGLTNRAELAAESARREL
jgi:predicted ATPase/class 3 adenylate cyclase/DNA-binding CsgD family transcriptional regulator